MDPEARKRFISVCSGVTPAAERGQGPLQACPGVVGEFSVPKVGNRPGQSQGHVGVIQGPIVERRCPTSKVLRGFSGGGSQWVRIQRYGRGAGDSHPGPRLRCCLPCSPPSMEPGLAPVDFYLVNAVWEVGWTGCQVRPACFLALSGRWQGPGASVKESRSDLSLLTPPGSTADSQRPSFRNSLPRKGLSSARRTLGAGGQSAQSGMLPGGGGFVWG